MPFQCSLAQCPVRKRTVRISFVAEGKQRINPGRFSRGNPACRQDHDKKRCRHPEKDTWVPSIDTEQHAGQRAGGFDPSLAQTSER